MSDRRRRKFTPLGDLLQGIVEQSLPKDSGLRAGLATEIFLGAAGPAVAGRCRVLGLKGDVLQVAVPATRWRRELQRMAGDYLRRVNEELPPPLRLAGIRFLEAQKKREP